MSYTAKQTRPSSPTHEHPPRCSEAPHHRWTRTRPSACAGWKRRAPRHMRCQPTTQWHPQLWHGRRAPRGKLCAKNSKPFGGTAPRAPPPASIGCSVHSTVRASLGEAAERRSSHAEPRSAVGSARPSSEGTAGAYRAGRDTVPGRAATRSGPACAPNATWAPGGGCSCCGTTHHPLPPSAVPCRAGQCSAVKCSAVQCSAAQCSAVQRSAAQ